MSQHTYNAQIAMAMLALVFMCSLAFVAGCGGDEETKSGGGFKQLDRMAFPAINTVLVPSAKKDLFNASAPSGDNAAFLADFTTTITALRTNVGGRGVTQNSPALVSDAGLADALCPDVVNVDLGATTGNVVTITGTAPTQTLTTLTLNGRNLTDDVIDAALKLILNNGGATDGIASTKTYSGVFPYLNTP
ncbi:hypothetical protein PLCT2_01459 [Planctomycetaceae bacterium]|nr:hypothetical protein PLCT2_01459 [Planctomycetaceae bacterium]